MTSDYLAEGLTVSMRKNADSGLYEFGVPFRDVFVVLGSRTPSVPDLEADDETARAAAAPADEPAATA